MELENLQRSIGALRVKNCDEQYFVPEDTLAEMMPRAAIRAILHSLGPAYIEEIIDFILNGALKVFAVLVMIGWPSKITGFVENGPYGGYQLDRQKAFARKELVDILKDDFVADLFFEKQWEFWVPTFSGQLMHRHIERRTILPYISETFLTKGGFGTLYRVVIHPSFHPPSFKDVKEVSIYQFLPTKGY